MSLTHHSQAFLDELTFRLGTKAKQDRETMKDELITQITFTDRGLNTREIRDFETVRTDSRGIHVTAHGTTTLYLWSNVFSVQYRETEWVELTPGERARMERSATYGKINV